MNTKEPAGASTQKAVGLSLQDSAGASTQKAVELNMQDSAGVDLQESLRSDAAGASAQGGLGLPPAYYAHGTSGWRAWWTLLHPPYTLMHLSFVVVGAALAPGLAWDRLGWTLLAFLLAMGFAAHALDELNGRPLGTRFRAATLWGVSGVALAGAALIGVWGALHYGLLWGFLFIPVGVVLVVGYNLELLGGRLHSDLSFVLAWGAFPVLVGYYAQAGRLDLVAVAGAAYAVLASGAQRVLSTPARDLRRRVQEVSGSLLYKDGSKRPVTRSLLLGAPENALRFLVWSALAVAGLLLYQAVG